GRGTRRGGGGAPGVPAAGAGVLGGGGEGGEAVGGDSPPDMFVVDGGDQERAARARHYDIRQTRIRSRGERKLRNDAGGGHPPDSVGPFFSEPQPAVGARRDARGGPGRRRDGQPGDAARGGRRRGVVCVSVARSGE